jgi:hypothetical protein
VDNSLYQDHTFKNSSRQLRSFPGRITGCLIINYYKFVFMFRTKSFLLKQGAYLLVALLVGTTTVFAATTISTNIQTDGTLSVTGASTLTGLATMGNASTTIFSSYGPSYFGATATSSFSAAGVLTLVSSLTTGNGGTGLSSAADGALLFGGIGGGTANLSALATSTGGSVLQLSFTTGRPTWVATSTLGLGGGVSTTTANTWTALQQFNGQASTTIFSSYGPSYFGATATTTITSAGNITVPPAGTLDVSSSGTFTIGGATATTINVGRSNQSVVFAGTASTSKLYVGGDQNNTINGIITGSCTISSTALTASTTSYVNCTGATGVTNSYNVVVTPVSLSAPVVIQSASSTATPGTIQIGLLDTGLSTTTSGGISATTVNFWAFR